jgi:hypothetical protein
MALDPSLNYLVGDWTDKSRTGEPGTATKSGESWRVDLGGRILIRMGWCEFPESPKRQAFRHEDLLIIYPEGEEEMRGIFWDNEGHTIHYPNVTSLPDGKGILLSSERATPGPRQQLMYVFEGPNRLTATFSLLLPGAPDFMPYLTWVSERSKPSSP